MNMNMKHLFDNKMYVMLNLTICYDTQKCHVIVINDEWIILSYETLVYTVNFILKFHNFNRKSSFVMK